MTRYKKPSTACSPITSGLRIKCRLASTSQIAGNSSKKRRCRRARRPDVAVLEVRIRCSPAADAPSIRSWNLIHVVRQFGTRTGEARTGFKINPELIPQRRDGRACSVSTAPRSVRAEFSGYLIR